MTGELHDKQNEIDESEIELHKVGIKQYKMPIMVRDKNAGMQQPIATFDAAVSLVGYKGTHMSRFVEVLQETGLNHTMNMPYMTETLLPALLDSQDAMDAIIEMTFDYFIHKITPVSKKKCMMPITATFRVESNRPPLIRVNVPVTTLCPCSKEISKYGAHNQRGWVTLEVASNSFIWIEDMVQMIEDQGSCPIYPLLKRSDEKYVTEYAYEHPSFVEDMVRNIDCAFMDYIDVRGIKVSYYRIECINEESIHLHNAWAERKVYLE